MDDAADFDIYGDSAPPPVRLDEKESEFCV